jgi:hypothetical protein
MRSSFFTLCLVYLQRQIFEGAETPKGFAKRRSMHNLLSIRAILLVGAFSLLPVSSAEANWALALQGAQTALNVLSAFSGSDSGMGAMLQAQQEMLKVVAAQLNTIYIEIVKLADAVSKLDEETRATIWKQYSASLVNKILSKANRYREYAEASEDDPNIIDSAYAREELFNIYQEVADLRNELMLWPDGSGYGPDAVFVIPVSCALEMACGGRAGVDPALLKTTLRQYEKWLEGTLSDMPGSLLRFKAEAAKKHDRLLDDATVPYTPDIPDIQARAKRRFAEEFSLSKMTLDANVPLQTLGSASAIFASDMHKQRGDLLVQPNEQWWRKAFEILLIMPGGRVDAAVWEQLATLNLVRDDTLKAPQLRIEQSISVIPIHMRKSVLVDGWITPGCKTCRWYRCQSEELDTETEAIHDTVKGWRPYQQDITELGFFQSRIDELNYQRALMAFSDSASEVAAKALETVRVQLRALGG